MPYALPELASAVDAGVRCSHAPRSAACRRSAATPLWRHLAGPHAVTVHDIGESDRQQRTAYRGSWRRLAALTLLPVLLGVDSWVWVLPTGEHVVDQETVTVTPAGAGAAGVSVRAVDDAGRDLEDVLEFSVKEP